MQYTLMGMSYGYSISRTFFLAKTLFFKELKSNHRESFMGYAWILAPSIILTVSSYLAYESNIIADQNLPLPYPVFAFLGVILWQLFSETILFFASALAKSRVLMLKLKLDTNAIIMSKLLMVLFDFAVKAVFLVVLLALNKVPFTLNMLLMPIGIGTILLYAIAVGLVVSPFVLILQDLNRLLPTALSFGMFLTPVFYATSQGLLGKIVNINPLTHVMHFCRSVLYTQPAWDNMLIIILVGILLIPIAFRFYRISLPIVVERLGN
jgi:lipopolysaccharide transport system permease protein